MSEITEELDALLERLEGIEAEEPPAPADAIERIARGPRRTSKARSMRDDPVMQRFRQELSDGLIRADTANQVLRLIGELVGRLAG